MSATLYGMGWLHDYPDFRDLTSESSRIPTRLKTKTDQRSVKDNLAQISGLDAPAAMLKPKEDLRRWCSPIEDQGQLGSCTANAGVGCVEYFEGRAFGAYTDASRLFLYKVTRDLMGLTGDTGAQLRTTMGALVLFGVPPERYWPYDIASFDVEPTAFLYAFAQNYQAISYYRLDKAGLAPKELLNTIKTWLAAGLPSMFGFTVFSSYTQAATNGGKFPFPMSREAIRGGHAVVAVGYDDGMKIKNSSPGAVETTGALLIRNSWGTGWGDSGYGWLPYDYVLSGLAVDWWSLIKNEWVDSKQFGLST